MTALPLFWSRLRRRPSGGDDAVAVTDQAIAAVDGARAAWPRVTLKWLSSRRVMLSE